MLTYASLFRCKLRGRCPLNNDWLETWEHFETILEFPAFKGQATLRVGSENPRDGSFEGVDTPVVYGGEC